MKNKISKFAKFWQTNKQLSYSQQIVKYLVPAILRAFILGVLMAIGFCPSCFVSEEQNNIHVLRYYIFTAFILWELASFLTEKLGAKIDWQTQTNKMIWVNVGFLFLIFFPLNACYIYLRFQVISDTPDLFDTNHMYRLFLNNMTMFLIFTFWLNGISFLKSWKKSVDQNKTLERQRLAYQLKALKNQINPHFLFNNLNTLSQIVKENSDLAEDFIHQLSKVYRYLLQQKDKNLVPIDEELKFLESFLFLIRIRFAEQTIIEVDKKGLQDFLIAPIVLQLLIENAIKHNEASIEFPLRISIFRKDNFLVVKNNFNPKGSIAYSSGIGLQNIQERYELLTNKPIEIEEDFKYFVVRIPVILTAIKTEKV